MEFVADAAVGFCLVVQVANRSAAKACLLMRENHLIEPRLPSLLSSPVCCHWFWQNTRFRICAKFRPRLCTLEVENEEGDVVLSTLIGRVAGPSGDLEQESVGELLCVEIVIVHDEVHKAV